MFDVVIFTKDRPAQYDLLIRSLADWRHTLGCGIYTLYKRTTKEMHAAYLRTAGAEYLREETTFKESLIAILEKTADKVVMLADDDVIVGTPTLDERAAMVRERCVSLRLHPLVDYCQPAKKQMVIPQFEQTTPVFKWRLKGLDKYTCWGYPNAIQNIHDSKTLIEACKRWRFKHSGELEVEMGALYSFDTHMVCADRPFIINLPWNQLGISRNPTTGHMTTEQALELFNAGYRIDLAAIKSLGIQNACHIDAECKWTR